MSKPLAIDLFCGLGGWTEGLLAEGYDVIGFDIERHVYGEQQYPAALAIQDVRTLHGSQFKNAALIVASPPCQAYSYMAMPWSRAKAMAAEYRSGKRSVKKLNALFDACFRIQREACEAAGRHVPMVVENVRGAIPWVGRSRWNFGSFHLWGDVPALMPPVYNGHKVPSFRFDGLGGSFQTASVRRTDVGTGARFTSRDCGVEGRKTPVHQGVKQRGSGHAWFDKALDERRKNPGGVKNGNDWFGSGHDCSEQRRHGSGSTKRQFASAMIAKIPLSLARHVAAVHRP